MRTVALNSCDAMRVPDTSAYFLHRSRWSSSSAVPGIRPAALTCSADPLPTLPLPMAMGHTMGIAVGHTIIHKIPTTILQRFGYNDSTINESVNQQVRPNVLWTACLILAARDTVAAARSKGPKVCYEWCMDAGRLGLGASSKELGKDRSKNMAALVQPPLEVVNGAPPC
jgi:hypothetical protein